MSFVRGDRFQTIDFPSLIHDKLVLVALPDNALKPGVLLGSGARDVLFLTRDGSPTPDRRPDHVRKRYGRLADVRRSNCEIGILHGVSSLALVKKHQFARFKTVLIPFGPCLTSAWLGLLRYRAKKLLSVTGKTSLKFGGRERTYLVLAVGKGKVVNRRQYGPAGQTPLQILQQFADLDYVLLNESAKIEAGSHTRDVDILLAEDSLPALKDRLAQRVGTYSLDIYTDSGDNGHGFNSVPFFMPGLARRILDSATQRASGIREASAHWQYVAFCYHLLFHLNVARPGGNKISPQSLTVPRYFDKLRRLAEAAGEQPPATFDDLEARLRDEHAFPGIDLIGFYSVGNKFLKKRYFEEVHWKPGLATFILRDFGRGLSPVDEIRKLIEPDFRILAEGEVTDANRPAILKGVRGGNWLDADAPGGRAPPVYWFVCWDASPKPPSFRVRRKYPRIDNEKVRIKDAIRAEAGRTDRGSRKGLRLLHSSDNTVEALEHIEHFGLDEDIAHHIRELVSLDA